MLWYLSLNIMCSSKLTVPWARLLENCYFFPQNRWCWRTNNLANNSSNISTRTWLVLTHHMTEYSPAKTGKYTRIFPNFQNCTCYKKDLKDNKHNGLHLVWQYAQIFVCSCSSKLTVFLELCPQKTVCLLGQIMSMNKYPSIFLCQIVPIVHVFYNVVCHRDSERTHHQPSSGSGGTKWQLEMHLHSQTTPHRTCGIVWKNLQTKIEIVCV